MSRTSKLLPTTHLCVARADDQGRDGLAAPGVLGSRENHPGEQLQSGSIRLEPNAGREFRNNLGPAYRVAEVDLGTPLAGDDQPFAPRAAVGLALHSLVPPDLVTHVPPGLPPARLRSLESLGPRRLARGRTGHKHDGHENHQREACSEDRKRHGGACITKSQPHPDQTWFFGIVWPTNGNSLLAVRACRIRVYIATSSAGPALARRLLLVSGVQHR